MARRSPDEVFAALIAAGWPADAAVTMTAIAGAESGYDDTVLGDQALQNATWGPSYGLFQIRTVKADTGTGGARDINRLATGDLAQAQAAFAISGGGADFSAWSVYNTGAYQAHLAAARAAAQRAGDAGGDGPLPTLGPDWLPWNWPSVLGNEAIGGVQDQAGAVLGGARYIAIEGVAVVVGLGLVALGLWTLSRPQRALFGRAQAGVRKVAGL